MSPNSPRVFKFKVDHQKKEQAYILQAKEDVQHKSREFQKVMKYLDHRERKIPIPFVFNICRILIGFSCSYTLLY